MGGFRPFPIYPAVMPMLQNRRPEATSRRRRVYFSAGPTGHVRSFDEAALHGFTMAREGMHQERPRGR